MNTLKSTKYLRIYSSTFTEYLYFATCRLWPLHRSAGQPGQQVTLRDLDLRHQPGVLSHQRSTEAWASSLTAAAAAAATLVNQGHGCMSGCCNNSGLRFVRFWGVGGETLKSWLDGWTSSWKAFWTCCSKTFPRFLRDNLQDITWNWHKITRKFLWKDVRDLRHNIMFSFLGWQQCASIHINGCFIAFFPPFEINAHLKMIQ